MIRFILKRLAYTVLVIIGVSIISFVILHLAPGDPARMLLPDGASEEQVNRLREELGLNKPLYEQYFIFIKNAVQGNLGNSIFYKQPNLKVISAYLPATFKLAGAAMVVALLISIPLGIIAGVKRGSVADFLSMLFALMGQSISTVWLGLSLVLIFAVKLRIFPPFGYGSIQNLVMPAFTLGIPLAAIITRMIRAGMIEVLEEDYILSAKAKGALERVVIFKYALKNVLIPVVTILGLELGGFLGGAIVTESVFGWPGVGRLIVTAIMNRDFPLVQSILLVVSTLFVLVNIFVDIIYTFLDPRLRLN